jgi:hypothetical protein
MLDSQSTGLRIPSCSTSALSIRLFRTQVYISGWPQSWRSLCDKGSLPKFQLTEQGRHPGPEKGMTCAQPCGGSSACTSGACCRWSLPLQSPEMRPGVINPPRRALGLTSMSESDSWESAPTEAVSDESRSSMLSATHASASALVSNFKLIFSRGS